MRKRFLKSMTILAMALVFVACKDKAKEAETTAAEDAAEAQMASVKYKADQSASNIEWKGFKPTGTHNGTIAIESGVFTVNNGNIESGTFLIDMKSIEVADIPKEDEDNAKLAGHLMSPDFFNVEEHPTAAFEITGFETMDGKTMLSGNLTIKDKKNNITIPVSVSEDGDSFTISSETFTIDRSKWDVRYGSKSFFDDLGDRFINDDIELKIMVKGNKA